jgi:cysteine-S-conjugate beta-lyase
MNYDFDKLYDRRQTGSIKWDFNQKIFGREDILPLWVADMDFPAPNAVVEALVNRAKHGIYGYTDGMEGYYDSLIEWMRERHGWSIEREWIVFSPGIVPALNLISPSIYETRGKNSASVTCVPSFFSCYSESWTRGC